MHRMVKMNEPVKHIPAGNGIFAKDVFYGDDNHIIVIEAGENLAIEFGTTSDLRFEHEMALCGRERTFDFKHESPVSGEKSWTTEKGYSFFMIFPRSAINIVLKKLYSYVKLKVNGVEVTLNVSGGTFNDGWTDLVFDISSACLGNTSKDYKRLAAVAIRDEALEKKIAAHIAKRDR